MDKVTGRILNIILGVSIIFGLYYIFVNNQQNMIKISILCSLLIVSVSIRHMIVYNAEKFYYIGKFLILFDIVVIYFISKIDISGVSQIFLMVISGDAIIAYDIPYSALTSLLCLFSYSYSVYTNRGFTSIMQFLPDFFGNAISFLFIFGVMYISKYQINQREKLIKTAKELEIKTKQLEDAYEKLKGTYKALEEVTILEERNRIAREIHDTVGHTLTTVLVEIEAGKRLIKKDTELAVEKLDLAQEQVRNGLNNIRKSVRMLKEGDPVMEFLPSLESLIHETEKHAGVTIHYNISKLPPLGEAVEKALYRALQEGITNGIKHGKSLEFDFSLSFENNVIIFVLKDYGIGCKDIIPSFGLTSMKDRIEELKGFLFISPNSERGCTIKIKIPHQEEKQDE